MTEREREWMDAIGRGRISLVWGPEAVVTGVFEPLAEGMALELELVVLAAFEVGWREGEGSASEGESIACSSGKVGMLAISILRSCCAGSMSVGFSGLVWLCRDMSIEGVMGWT